MSRRKLTKVQRRVLHQVHSGTFSLGAPYSRYLIFKRLAQRGYLIHEMPVQRSILADKGRAALYR